MSNRDLTIRFLGDSKGIVRAAKDAISGLDDTETKAQAVAKALVRMADQSEAEMRDAASAADALGAAIGDELRADIERAGGSVDQYIADLRRAGLTYDEIRADADALGDALKRTAMAGKNVGDDINVGARTASDGLSKVRKEGDQSRSVLANMVGNSAQDLGELGGIAGTLGVGLGQLGEYAADGNIKLGNLAKVAGPMAALGLVMYGLQLSAKKNAEQLKEMTEAMGDLSRVTDSLVIKTFANALVSGLAAGESLNEVIDKMATDNLPGLKRALDLGTESGEFNANMQALLNDAIVKAETATAQQTKTTEEYGSAADTAAEAVKAQQEAEDKANEARQEAEDRFRDATAAADEYQSQIEELYGVERTALEAQDAWAESVENLDEVLGNSDASLRSQKDAAIAASEAYATMNGATLNSEAGTRRQIESLYGLAVSLAPDSPLRKALVDYIGQLAAIPPEVNTRLRLNISQGQTSTRDGDAIGGRYIPGGTNIVGATGGIVTRPTLAMIGEAGPEAVVPLNRTPGSSPLGGVGGVTNNITINALNADQIVDAINRATRLGYTINGLNR